MILEYKHIHAHVKYSPITKTYYGEFVLNNKLIVFMTSQREDLKAALHAAIANFEIFNFDS